MRFYQINHTRQSPLLRWYHFEQRRAWLDLDAPQVHVVLQLLGDGAADIRLGATDRNGDPLPLELEPPVELPDGLPLFRGQPAAKRRLIGACITFPAPAPVHLVDTVTGTELMRLVPEIVFPDHVFALIEEARNMGFAPDGFDHFIETGTLFGHTTLHASHWVDTVVTIELSDALHAQATTHLAHRPNITCLQGNSTDHLPQVIADHPGTAFYFLDAHWSGDSATAWEGSLFSGYPVDTARIDDPALSESERQVPLKLELEQVADAHVGRALILIDDWGGIGRQGFAFNGEDWSHLDAATLLDWIAAHPRTVAAFHADPKRYVWMIGDAPSAPEDP